MTVRVVRTRAANRDSVGHAVYIGQDDPRAADRFLDAVANAFARIGAFPKIGALRSDTHPAFPDVRLWPIPDFERYLIFYRAEDTRIKVIRVLNGARGDIADALSHRP